MNRQAARRSRRTRLTLVLGAGLLVVVVAVVVAILVTRDDDDTAKPPESRTSTTTSPSTTTTTEPASPSSAPPSNGEETAIWPFAGGGTTYADPVDAARGFAVDFVGFTDPTVGEFTADGTGSGHVDIVPFPNGPPTTVHVRELTPGSWSVVRANSPIIEVDEPQAGATISSPVRLTGRASAFEGNVQVEVLADGTREPIGTGFVTASGTSTPGPFDGEVEFTPPTQDRGVVLLLTRGGEDGRILEATAVPVRFAGA